jgi:hypothetical protein
MVDATQQPRCASHAIDLKHGPVFHRSDSSPIASETEGKGEEPPSNQDRTVSSPGCDGPCEASGVPQGSTPSFELQLGEGDAGLAAPLCEWFGVRKDDQARVYT